MTLKCKVEVTGIKRKSKSPALKDIQIGDVLECSCRMEDISIALHGGTNFVKINVVNLRTKERSITTSNRIDSLLNCVWVKECKS